MSFYRNHCGSSITKPWYEKRTWKFLSALIHSWTARIPVSSFNRDCLVYMFSLRFSGSKLLINLRRQYRVRKNFSCKLNFWVVKHVRLHWNSWRWSYCFMCESFKNTELPEKKCQHSTEIPEGEAFSNTICPEGKNSTFF